MQSHDPSIELGRSVTLFPDPADVFAEPVDGHLEHLHPVASVDLALLDDSLSGVVHVVSPLEPHEGYPGEHTEAYHSEFLGPNWIAFRLVAGRYRLHGDLRYFFLENDKFLPDDERVVENHADFRSDMERHYDEQRSSYEQDKQIFVDEGWNKASPIEQLGGKAMWGNWSAHLPPPSHYSLVEDPAASTATVYNTAGHELIFVASMPGWRFRSAGADSILLFYDVVEQVALLTFDWT